MSTHHPVGAVGPGIEVAGSPRRNQPANEDEQTRSPKEDEHEDEDGLCVARRPYLWAGGSTPSAVRAMLEE